jgi:hypothetical protein
MHAGMAALYCPPVGEMWNNIFGKVGAFEGSWDSGFTGDSKGDNPVWGWARTLPGILR